MAAGFPTVNISYPKVRETYTKYVQVVRTDTTAFVGAVLPKDAVVVGAYVMGAAVSNAVTTATISVGNTATANEIINSFDVKAATGAGYHPAGAAAVGTYFANKLTSDQQIFFKYAETGGASTLGGPWVVKLEYYVPGAGETL